MTPSIEMVDLKTQYRKIEQEVLTELQEVMQTARFIKGPKVQELEENLAKHLDVKHVIACANGTDALQIALMALDLQSGDEVIVPAFTYAATAEVIALLQLTPVLVDVDIHTFNMSMEELKKVISPRTRVIIPVHLFGQSTEMEALLELANENNIAIIEDNAQSIGAMYTFKDGLSKMTGTIGDIACTSFFPSKNLGCYGDGGAMMTNNDVLANRLRKIANHGQSSKYYHEIIGVNSRLDAMQAAILNIKLKYLDVYQKARQKAAALYDELLSDIPEIITPKRLDASTHVFHQYTLRVLDGKRDDLQKHLKECGIPSTVYYPAPLHQQEAYKHFFNKKEYPNAEQLCSEVLSLPMHTELKKEEIAYICEKIRKFYIQK